MQRRTKGFGAAALTALLLSAAPAAAQTADIGSVVDSIQFRSDSTPDLSGTTEEGEVMVTASRVKPFSFTLDLPAMHSANPLRQPGGSA